MNTKFINMLALAAVASAKKGSDTNNLLADNVKTIEARENSAEWKNLLSKGYDFFTGEELRLSLYEDRNSSYRWEYTLSDDLVTAEDEWVPRDKRSTGGKGDKYITVTAGLEAGEDALTVCYTDGSNRRRGQN